MPTTSLGFYPFLLLTWWAHNLNISQWRLCLRNLRNWLWCIQCMPHQPIWRKERSVHKKNPICLNRPFLWSEASHTVLCKVNGPAALWSSLNCDHLLLASVTPQTPGITRQHFNRVAASLCQHSWNLLTRRTASREFHQAKDPSRIARATDQAPWYNPDTISVFLFSDSFSQWVSWSSFDWTQKDVTCFSSGQHIRWRKCNNNMFFWV